MTLSNTQRVAAQFPHRRSAWCSGMTRVSMRCRTEEKLRYPPPHPRKATAERPLVVVIAVAQKELHIAGGRLRSQREGRPGFDGEETPAKAGLRLHSPALLATTGGCGTHRPRSFSARCCGRSPSHSNTGILVRQSSQGARPGLGLAQRGAGRGALRLPSVRFWN